MSRRAGSSDRQSGTGGNSQDQGTFGIAGHLGHRARPALTVPAVDADHLQLRGTGRCRPHRRLPGRESLSATLSPVVHSIPEDDWVSAEAEALLDATPGLREDLRAAMDELHAGTLQTVDAATARARIEARIKSRGSF